jgi:hypothetical protein
MDKVNLKRRYRKCLEKRKAKAERKARKKAAESNCISEGFAKLMLPL